MTEASRGVVTIASGNDQYLMLAGALLKSIRINSPATRVAVVTDRLDHPVAARFDDVVPFRADWGPPFLQKLHLADYAPYDETLYIDADCLVYGPLEEVWSWFADHGPVGVLARATATPNWCQDLSRLPAKYQVDSYLEFNGGLYYLRRGTDAEAIFAEARDVYQHSDEFGLMNFGAAGADEPSVALVLSRLGYPVVDDHGHGMRTPSALTGRTRLNIAGRAAAFTKWGTPVTPLVVHFAGGRWRRRIYRQQLLAVRLITKSVPRPVARLLAWCALGAIPTFSNVLRRVARRPMIDGLAPD